MISNNLCNSCINIGCEFQSGIVRTECAFYMPPNVEPDNCGNYVIQPTVNVLDKIRGEIEQMDFDFGDYYDHTDEIIEMVCKTIDKYKIESEGEG